MTANAATPPNYTVPEAPTVTGLVSVIIPAYNAERFLRETVASVLAQTYPHFEVIIVEDGAKDGTGALADQLAAEDSRVTAIHQPNGGVSRARNHGFRRSQGEFVAFLDADDVWEPDNLSQKVAYLQAYPEVGLVSSAVSLIDGESKPLGRTLAGRGGKVLNDLLYWDGGTVQSPSSFLTRRDVVLRTGCFDPRLSTSADREFYMRVAQHYTFGYIDQPLLRYRVSAGSMSTNVPLMERDEMVVYHLADEYKMFQSRNFRARCRSHLYHVLAGSYWVNARNKRRGMYFLWRSFWASPAEFTKQMCKRIARKR